MKRRNVLEIFLRAVLVSGLLTFPQFVVAQTNRILLVGDSITKGVGTSVNGTVTDSPGFRDDLFNLMQQAEIDFDFVGSRMGDPTEIDLEGFFQTSATIDNFFPSTFSPLGTGDINPDSTFRLDVGDEVNAFSPNIVVIHLGTNDILLEGQTGQEAAEELKELIRYVVTFSSVDFVIVSQIIPFRTSSNIEIIGLNNELVSVTGGFNRGDITGKYENVILVDNFSPFRENDVVKTELYFDNAHPNNSGYLVMAQSFLGVLASLLQSFTDDFDRANGLPGDDWEADPGVVIINNELGYALEPSGAIWNKLAILKSRLSPTSVSFKYGSNNTTADNGAVGLLVRATQSNDESSVSGYLCNIFGSSAVLSKIENGGFGNVITSSDIGIMPQAGNIFSIVTRTTNDGIEFDYLLNGERTITLFSANPQSFGSSPHFAGVAFENGTESSQGEIDDFKVFRETATVPRIFISSGNNQFALASTDVPLPIVVLMLDEDGNPLPDTSVTFTVASGNGSLEGSTIKVVMTGANGEASTNWTLGPDPGSNIVTATAPGFSGSPQTFTAIGLPGEGELLRDSFDRAELGPTWEFDPDISILENELGYTVSPINGEAWNKQAIFVSEESASIVSLRYSSGNVGAVGLIIGANSTDPASVDGYLCSFLNSKAELSLIENGRLTLFPLAEANTTAHPQLGDIFSVTMRSTDDGFEFEYFLDGISQAILTDPDLLIAAPMSFGGVVFENLSATRRATVDDFALIAAESGFGQFVVTKSDDSGAGSLRQAILDANSNNTPDFIFFNIDESDTGFNPSTGTWTIQPLSPMPTLTDDRTSIDGSSQSRFIGRDTNPDGPEIELDGSAAGDVNGLVISSPDNVIKNLVIHSFTRSGIALVGGGDRNKIIGCYIGTDHTGTRSKPNAFDGVRILNGPSENVVGGTTSGSRNVISGNTQIGVRMIDANGNKVFGNYIGTDRTGTLKLANGNDGVSILRSQNNIIGGSAPGERNIISGNNETGILILESNSFANSVKGNYIGTDASGGQPLRNGGDGVRVSDGAQNNLIGGGTISDGNLIRFNGSDGIEINGDTTNSNTISHNSISQNSELGINNINGGNADLQPPIITGPKKANAADAKIRGTAVPNVTIEVFSDPNEPNDEGFIFIGSTTADGAGNWSLIPTFPLVDDIIITANATDGSGNTSEFSSPPFVIRIIAGSIFVTNTNDSGEGSLRQAILMANQSVGPDSIGFLLEESDPGYDAETNTWTIHLLSIMPSLEDTTGGTKIDGSRLIDSTVRPSIELDGSNANFANGITITSADNTIRGLVINRFVGTFTSGNGILIRGDNATGNVVAGNFIGTDVTGTRGDFGNITGIQIFGGAANNTIGGSDLRDRNIISGNGNGIEIRNAGTDDNRIVGNFIGLDVIGTASIGNSLHGVLLTNGAKGNIIGGAMMQERNIISGNAGFGILIERTGTDNNKVKGNFIGTDVSGNSALGNSGNGIKISVGAKGNSIGGSVDGEGNLISGNQNKGISIADTGTNNNVIKGNIIGTNLDGVEKIANSSGGIEITSGAQGNVIGGSTPSERNLISGNNRSGILIADVGTDDNEIRGNYIGTKKSGGSALGNAENGITISGGAKNNSVGGSVAGDGNLISGNEGIGISIANSGTNGNNINGNMIGTDKAGAIEVANSFGGIEIRLSAQGNIIGGSTETERNLISGNGGSGVTIADAGTDRNKIKGNFIGTEKSGSSALGNSENGITISGEAKNNSIGGSAAGEGNLVSGNRENGIRISNSHDNIIVGNLVGTDVSGTISVGNKVGVQVTSGAKDNRIGGATPTERNLISGNGGSGIVLDGTGTNNSWIIGNFIGTDISGSTALGNSGDGVTISRGAEQISVGGSTGGEGNLISGNGGFGISITDSSTTGNEIKGNHIGTDLTGGTKLGNISGGIEIRSSTHGNIIGGSTESESNLISGNGGPGILIADVGTDDNEVKGNFIGTEGSGSAALSNSADGLTISGGAKSNTIGGNVAGEGNLISGNEGIGIDISGNGTNGNKVIGNVIGTDRAGARKVANTSGGIEIKSSAQGNVIGGSTPGERNLISGNEIFGIVISDAGTSSNQVKGNFVGTDINGAVSIGNSISGVQLLNNAEENIIGGSVSGDRNVISGNDGLGVLIFGSNRNMVKGNFIGMADNGADALGNISAGVSIQFGAQENVIGGASEGESNIISSNGRSGVFIGQAGTDGNKVSGNYIGTDVTGTVNRANSEAGIQVSSGAQNNLIGGQEEVDGNLIRFNNFNGVLIEGSTTIRNAVSHNVITENVGLGIENLAGGNTELAAPQISGPSAPPDNSPTITGTALPNQIIELFSDPNPPNNQGAIFLGMTNSDDTGSWSLTTIIPLVAGTNNLTATATDGDGNTSEFSGSFPVSIGFFPDIQLSTAELNFGNVRIGDASEMDLVISNQGIEDLMVTGIISNDPQFTVSDSSITVAPSDSLNVTVTFSPASVGEQTGRLTITSNDPNEATLSVGLSGTGIGVPEIALSRVSLEFGPVEVDSTAISSLVILNDGSEGLTISDLTIDTGDFFTATSISLPLEIAVGDSSEVEVKFTPTRVGTINGVMTISSNVPGKEIVQVTLVGDGYVIGDVTGDGAIDVTDLVRTISIILRLPPVATEREAAAADFTRDGVINVADLIGIINLILGIG